MFFLFVLTKKIYIFYCLYFNVFVKRKNRKNRKNDVKFNIEFVDICI